MKQLFLLLLATFIAFISKAQNPIIQTRYTADPAPLVYNDKLYLYVGQDEANSSWFNMNNWALYTTTDMVNWTDHGTVLSYHDFEWAAGDAWAAQCIEREGKFYFYVTAINRATHSPAVGVAVADSPYGPFIDPLGKPLVQSGVGDIDPTVFIDEDGRAFLYWGNPNCYYVELNEDMISYTGDIVQVPMTGDSFGVREGNIAGRPTLYEEGPWLYKRNNLYYLLWAGGPVPEHLGYSTSQTPVGPWLYRGMLMETEGRSFTNHPGVADYKGKTYLFYHNGALPRGSGFTRSVCVEEMEFNQDGTIKPLKMTEGIRQGLQPLNPYVKTEAGTIAFSEGVKAARNKEAGTFIHAVRNGAYTRVREVDFRDSGTSRFTARVGTTHYEGITLEVRLDALDGPLLGTIEVPYTGGDNRWSLVTMEVERVTGIHDLFFVFKGEKPGTILYFDYWMFKSRRDSGNKR